MEKYSKPLELFKNWYEAALGTMTFEPTKMVLATVSDDGMPAVRTVLLKKYSDAGFEFYTNYGSNKYKQIEKSPKAAVAFHWEKPTHRQVRMSGFIEKMTYEESNTYFQSRHRGSQIGAWASPQSQVIKDRKELLERVKQIEEKFAGKEIPCPEFWGGLRLKPLTFEFWESKSDRLHDRLKISRKSLESPWESEFLAP